MIHNTTLRWLIAVTALSLIHAAPRDSSWGSDGYTIFIGQAKTAKRVNVVSSGGYFPVLIRLDNGELVAVVRRGATHIGIKGRLDLVRSKDQGNTWIVTRLVESNMDARNPAVGQLRDGTILVTYIVDRSYKPDGTRLYPDALHRDGLYTIRSVDHGKTWSAPIKSEIPVALGGSPYGKMIQLPDGTALLNVYYERGPHLNHETSMLYRSRDGGKTWGDPSIIADNFNETGLLYLPDGRLLAMARAHTGQYLSLCYSSDKGRTWTDPRQITANMEHPADVILLHDKRLLLVYGERNRPFGARARLSSDLGKTWGPPIILAGDAQSTDCGYPSSVEVAPGKVVTIYYGVGENVEPVGKALDILTGKSFAKVTAPLSGAYARAVLWEPPVP